MASLLRSDQYPAQVNGKYAYLKTTKIVTAKRNALEKICQGNFIELLSSSSLGTKQKFYDFSY